MVRVLVATSRNPQSPGGVERFCRMLRSVLSDRGWEVDFLTAQQLTGRSTFSALQELIASHKIAKTILACAPSYDVIITNSPWGAWLPLHLPRVNMIHGTYAASYRAAFKTLSPKRRVGLLIRTLLERRSARSEHNVALSEQVAREMALYHRRAVDAVVEYGVDLDYYRPASNEERRRRCHEEGLPSDCDVVIFSGRMEFAKGLDYFNGVAALCRVSGQRAQFLVVTPRVERRWQSDKVIYRLGSVEASVRDAYRLASVMLFPSRYESWGLAMMEALACGLPVVGAPTGILASLRDREPVLGKFVTDGWSESQFYERLNLWFDLQHMQREAVRRRAREHAESRASLSRFSRQWIEIIEAAAA